jgi:hypothetical protein
MQAAGWVRPMRCCWQRRLPWVRGTSTKRGLWEDLAAIAEGLGLRPPKATSPELEARIAEAGKQQDEAIRRHAQVAGAGRSGGSPTARRLAERPGR